MNLEELRRTMPTLNGLSDQDAVDVVHQVYYPTRDKAEIANKLGVALPAPPPPPAAGVMRTAGDVGVKLAQGVVDLGSAAVGLSSLATGGLVGKGARAVGFNPEGANEKLGEYLSDSQRAADDKVAKAEGFIDTLGAALQNPRAILGTVAQSAPGMVAGMGVQAGVARAIAARAALATTEGAAASAAQLAAGKGAAEATKAALATTTGKIAATKAVDAAGTRLIALGAATEGAQSAGQIADGAQAKGRDYTDYALPALAAGVGTAAISLGAGKLMGDSATQIATGAQSAGVKGSMLKRAGKEALSEGVLEEMPQSAQEQVFTNIANGEQDITQGVGNAAATGMLAGGAMGAGLGVMQRPAPPLPNTGPLSQAANAGQAAAAAQANATAPQDAPAPAAVPAPEDPALSLEQIDARMAQLVAIGRGQLGGRTQAPDGSMVKTLAVQPRPLTAEETAEFEALKQARTERTSIPADQQAEFQAALAAEQDEHNRKHQATMQAAAAARSEAEDRQIAQLLAQDEERTRAAEAAAQQKTLAAELAAQQAAIAESDARVEQGRRERAIANRVALRDRIANDDSVARDQKTAAFRAALAADGYTDTLVTAEDRAWFKEATAPLPSAPNELINAVPERQAPAPVPKATNTRAVDDAIAAGMRLKTANGKVLHKPGSSKVFTLSTEQRAYYLAAMASAKAAETPQQITDSVSPAVQAPVDGANSVTDAANATLALAAPGDLEAPAPVTAFDQAAHGAATSPHNDLAEPSAAQKEAGNYKLGKATIQGLPLSIENPVGSTRRGVDEDGTPWETIMAHHYGYIRGTKGADKDHIDTFIGPNQASDKVFVIDQVNPATGKFDEHKVMLGFDTATEAQAAYKANYADNWQGGDNITSTTVEGFKDWLASGKTTRPFAKAQERSAAPTADDIAARALLKATPEPAATALAAPVEPAPAVPAPPTRQQLYRMTVKDMSDAQLLQARDVLADSPRAPKIEKEIKARGLAAAPAIEPHADVTNATVPEEGQPIPASDVPTDEDLTDPDPAPPTKPRTTKDGESSAPAQRVAPNLPDLKTYSTAEAKAEWDGARAGKRGMFLGRIDQRDSDIVDKNWDEMAPAERDLIHHALNEDFYSPAWFINTNGERIDRVAMPEVPVKSPETVEQEAGAQRWAQTEPRERHFALLGAGVGADADQGQYVDWDKLGPDVRKRVAANFAANPLERIERDKIASRYAALLARDGVSDAPTDFHRKFADQLMAKDAYALKWVTNGMNDKAKKVFSEFTGVKLPKAQGTSWEAIKQWAGITPEQDAAHAAAVESANQAKRDEEDAAAAERAVESQRFRVSATDEAVISGKQAIDRQIADGYDTIANISKSAVPKYALVNNDLQRYYVLDKVGKKYAEVALKRLGQAAGTQAVDADQLATPAQGAAWDAEHARELADAAAKGQTVISDEDAGHLFGTKTTATAVEKPDDIADTDKQLTGQNNDSTDSVDSPALNLEVVASERPAGSEAVARGAAPARAGNGRADDGGLREPRGHLEGANDGEQDLGNAGRTTPVPDGPHDPLAGSDSRVPASDFQPPVGGLTREGSWYDTARRNVDLIELALRIEQEGRPATQQEQAQLAKYVGFGAGEIRNKLFPVPGDMAKRQDPERLLWPQFVAEPRWRELAERMEALPRAWQKSVLQSSQYAHYTSEGIIRSVWSAVQRMGFTGGKVFEPGMGIGSFAMLMPGNVRTTSSYTGVEFDGPTATIAKLLSPEQNMLHDDFIKRKFPKDYFDVVIGNPPFSATKVFADPDYEKNGFMLHDFFFAKSIDRVRPGGLLAFVTSKGTMDKQTDKARNYLAERADLLGAIRLPSTAFEANAGTSVVTDVIFLRKRLPGEQPGGQPWANVQTIDTKDGPVVVNEYFAANPDMVLGQQRISGFTDDAGRRINSNGRGAAQYTVVSYDETPAQLDDKFAAAIERLPQHVYSVLEQSAGSVRRETAKVDFDPSIKRDGVVYIGNDGTVMRVESGVGRPLAESTKLTAADTAWFKGYVGLRDLVQAARLAQTTDGNWEAALKQLNKAYDAFRKAHGPINDYRLQVRKSTDEEGKVVETTSKIYKNRRRYREDYDAAVLTQLETINEAGDIVKAPFLLDRTIGVPATREIKSIGDALAVSLDGLGRLDLDDIARRMGLSQQEAVDALGDQVFKTPAGAWQLADEYLSGDVVAKLEEAEQAARVDASLRRNVVALTAAQPEKLGPSQISAKLGSAWISAEHINHFAKEIEAGAVTFDPTTETWQVDGGNLRSGRSAAAQYGTAKRSPSELLEAVLNSRPLKVTFVTEDKKTATDVEATTAANEAAKKIKDKFRSWVWTDAERASELVESYNRRFNNIAPRRFDGSHLTLPGVSMRYALHSHQKNGIWRNIQVGDTYLAHAVGAGKTIEMIAAGMEQKRLGLINKPMYVVPNHMLEQFSNEFMELYPLANIMVADDENFSAERRKAFIASATLNKPDAVIITHDAFQRIGVKEESVAPIRDAILTDLEIELSETANSNETRVRRSQLEQQIEAVTQRFDRIISAGGKDSTIKFEDIGVDYIFADEAHVYRKLDFHTAQQIKGIDPNGSKRALDMYVKTRYLQQQRPGRAMTFASGTPITNTMGELYTIMRFFVPHELDRAGISTFDSWARMFGEVAPALEPNAAGKYELVERFAKFDNVPELMSRVRQFMDVLTSEHLGALVKRPDLAGGKPNLNVVEPTEQLQDYMANVLGPRIEKSKRWKPSKEQPSNPDPIVAIITDGRFAALDPRFFGAQLGEGEQSILTTMAAKVVHTHHATADNIYLDKAGKPEPIKGSTQMVFFNLGFGEQSQINRGFNSRAAFNKLLVDGGIPRAQIAWFEDANTDAKKEAIFKGMRSGQIRVLIGSAKKMGTGVNAQKRLIKLHYQDPPWFPSDVEQPHGRIIRQGNQNGEVGIEWYTTKGTYQSTMWQMVARKQRFIDQAFTGDKSMRSMDDLGEASLFEQAAAVASGDPRAMQLAGLKQEVTRLERLQAAHANEQIAVRSAINGAEWTVKSTTGTIATYDAAFKVLGERHYAFTDSDVMGETFDKLGEFGQAVKDAFNTTAAKSASSHKVLQDVMVASLPGGVTLTMDSDLGADGKKTGDMDLNINIGDLSIAFTSLPRIEALVDATGFARRIINTINGVGSELKTARSKLTDAQTDLVRLRKKRGAPFEYQQELAEKYGDLQRLEEELRQEGVAASNAMRKQLDEAEAAAAANATAEQAAPVESSAEDDAPGDDANYFRNDAEAFAPDRVEVGNDNGGKPVPGDLPGLDLLQAMKDTEQLNRQLIKQGMAPVRALRAAPNAQYAMARQIGEALGIKVHFVGQNSEFEGVAHNGVAYLAEGMRNPELAIAGHEVLHVLEQMNPAAGKQLRERMRAYLKDGVVAHRQAREYAASGFQDVSIEKAEGEVLADINGAMWLDPQFWRDLARADRSLFRTVAYKFMELASKAVNAMRSARFDVSQLVIDVAAVRAIMVDTWAQHAQRQGRGGAAPGAPAFSGNGDAQSSLAAARDASRQFAEAELQYGGRAAYDALKADGGTFLSYPQWIMTKTANFKQFYGDWEAGNGQSDSGSIPGREQGSGDARGLYSGADVAAGSSPTFPGQSGPIRAVGSDAESSSIEPVVYYHGSRDDITEFDLDHPGRKDNGWLGTGVYGTSDDFVAASYASIKKGDQNPNIMPMFMAVKNPFVATPQLKNRLRLASREKINEFTADLAARGFDGVVLKFNDGSQELVAFNPAAVKSAIGNNGGFDTGSADLRYSRTNQTDSPEFKAWFGKSKMVASDGAPMVLYHATKSDFSAFDPSGVGAFGRGIYLSGMPSRLTQYWGGFGQLGERHGPNGGNIMPVYVKLENPAELQQADAIVPTDKESRSKYTALQQRLIRAGHDGMVSMLGGKVWEAVVFSPEQIKSAIGNNGDFDPSNDDIRFSRANLGETLANAANSVAAVRLPAGYLVGDLFNKSGKISWWHKTIGTMDNMARRHPLFAPVYEAVQSFLGDVSRFGVVAADKAPTLLPKLENVADVIGKNRKKALTAADTKAIGAPIFEGTLTWARDAHGEPVKVAELEAQAEQLSSAQKAQILINKGIIDDAQNRAWQAGPIDFYDNVINKKFGETQLAAGVVWSNAELRSLFRLNDYQIGLYHEFRAALNKSLTNLTITEMVKLGGKDANGTLEQALAAPDLAAAALLLRDHFVELARMHPQQADMHLDTAKQVMDLGDKGINLMARGYAPLSRFGKYTVYVEQGGEQVYFGMFETQYEASRMARQMRADHPDAEVSHGTVSEDAFKLFAGVSPETIELFGSMIGLDSQADAASTEVYQAYLKLAKNNRSAMKRMIQRKGIAGFSEDAGRVLAGFIYSNARLSAGNAHLGEMDEAITAIPKQQGELTDAAVQLRESIRNPQPGNRLGGLMFAQFLGGSVASAMVNLTQPLTMTLPFLSQYGGLAAASKQITAAVRDAAKDSTGEAHLDQALQWATDEGIVAPQEIHFLQAQAAGKGALMAGDGTRAGDARAMLNNTMSKVQLGWGKMFAMAEMANRRVTFIAAYRTAIAQNIPNPEKFAAATVSQTQGTYNSGNKPRWARNAIGGLLMTFKQYSIGYLELLTRMASAGEKGSKERAAGQRGALYMIAVLFLMAGADGLPFEQDIEDAIDGALQRMGYNFSTKRAKQEFLTGVLGEGGADFALKGISSVPGMPIDVAGRFGMGNLIPGTGMLTKKDSYTQDLGELAGPAGDVAKRAFSATGHALGGDVGGAFLEFSPAAVRNAAKGIDMLDSGAYKDTRGYKVNDVSPMEGVMKAIGFQPNSTANIQDAKGQALNMIGQNRMRSSEIQEHWAQGIASGKPEVVAEARAWRDDWNAKNPETPIRVDLPAIYRRVRGMRQDAVNRTQKTAPAALKATVLSELSDLRN